VNRHFLALIVLFPFLALAQNAPATKSAAGSPAPQATPAATPAKPPAASPAATPAKPPAAKPAATPEEPSLEIPEGATVLKIHDLCETKSKSGECMTTMTRLEFDKLVDALSGDRPAPPTHQYRRQAATALVHNMVFAKAAEKQGLDKTPEAQQLFRWVKLQVLAEMERRALQKKAEPTDADIAKYYNDNQDRYSELTFQRIMVPIHPGPDNKSTEADIKKLADDLHKRAMAPGADFDALQTEAYAKLGLKNPPKSKTVFHPNEIPNSQQAIKELKPAEISDVIQDGTGFYVYKLESKQVKSLADVKTEISKTLTPQRFKKEVDDLEASAPADYSQDYFGPPPGPQGHMPFRPPLRPGSDTGKPPLAPPAGQAKAPAPGAPAAPAQANAPAPGAPAAPAQPKTAAPATPAAPAAPAQPKTTAPAAPAAPAGTSN